MTVAAADKHQILRNSVTGCTLRDPSSPGDHRVAITTKQTARPSRLDNWYSYIGS